MKYTLTIIFFLMAILYMVKKSYDAVISRLADAIQKMEGYYPGSRAYRNNNPGNLRYIGQAGAIGEDDKGFAIFPDYETGRNALIRQLNLAFYGGSKIYNINMTLYDFFAYYDPTNSINYANFVAVELGVSADTRLRDLA